VPVTITGAAVATIASQASMPSRRRPAHMVDRMDHRRQRHRPTPRQQAKRPGLAERRQVVAQGVAADRQRRGIDLLVEEAAQRLGLADRTVAARHRAADRKGIDLAAGHAQLQVGRGAEHDPRRRRRRRRRSRAPG
jgi:hypothetical protein